MGSESKKSKIGEGRKRKRRRRELVRGLGEGNW